MKPPRGSSASLRGRLRRWAGLAHLWLGLSVGLVFGVAGITGTLLVFYVEADAATHQAVRAVAPVRGPVVYEPVLRALQAHAPQRPGAWRLEVTDEGGAIPVRYYAPAETQGRGFAPLMLWVDPARGTVVREAFWGEYLGTWIYDLHYALLMGDAGKKVMAVTGGLVLVLLLGGAWLWWPARGKLRSALTLKPAATPQRRVYDLHKVAGIYGLLPLLVLIASGVVLGAPEWFRPVLGPLYEQPELASAASAEAPRIPVDHAVARAQAMFPQARLAWIETPAGPDGVYRINLQQPGEPSRRFPRTNVWLDQYSGQVLAVRDPRREGAGDVLLNWMHAIHSGEAGGLAGRLLVFVSGLGAASLLVTGLIRFGHKRRARALAGRRETPIGVRPSAEAVARRRQETCGDAGYPSWPRNSRGLN
ncbi:PepSY-associated TM helix domain-containing protein [Phenylobacterium sp.]|uniref:PepSY-associated TM helix domain-containing protein n=1 Tax=Phenylobacterium sp. TaxID=1871053 RepID=UPI002FE174DD